MEDSNQLKELCNYITKVKLSRKKFLKTSAFLGGSLLLLSDLEKAYAQVNKSFSGANAPEKEYELAKAENILYTVCLQCNTGCGIKAKLLNGLLVKIEGNPFSPWTLTPHLPYKTSTFDTTKVDGTICPKGQSGIQTLYDPYRIVKVLKRAGARGSNKWQTISFEQAIKEVVDGGKIFAEIGEDRYVEGFKDVWKLRDAKILKAMAKKVQEIQDEKNKEKKKALVQEFKTEFKDYLNSLIDPEHPDLGPKNNQFVFMWGRLKAGRSELIARFTKDAFGSVNAHGHTTVCQGSLYFTGKAMSFQWDYDEKDAKMKWTNEKKFYWQCDTANSEFIIFVGASPFEANYGPPLRVGKLTENLVSGKVKFAVIDPRFSKTAAKAWKWIPALPGSEGAFALGMMRWIMENKRYDGKYLSNANKAAATLDKEPTWCNATWLVKVENGEPGAFLRGSDIGRAKQVRNFIDKKTGEEKPYEFDSFVVLKDGSPRMLDPNSEENPVEGNLFVDTQINGIRVKSAFQILYEQAMVRSIEEWADICGVSSKEIIELAAEFTSHGKKAAADIHRGVSQHTNGFYNVYAWYSLNLLIGNFDWKGGMCQLSTYNHIGEKAGQPYNFKDMHPGKLSGFGVDIIRQGDYEKSTIFSGSPAKRPWQPIASDVYQEIIPSIGDAYPYPIKILMSYMAAPTYSLPAGQTNIEILADTNKVPLYIANDITIGVTSMYADYIFPDVSYLERWELQGSHPSVPHKVQPIRQPVVSALTDTVKVFGEEMPLCLESLILGIAEQLGLSGFGKDGLGKGVDFKRQEDFYLKMVANVAFGEKKDGSDSLPDADDNEMDLFIKSRRHLSQSVFNLLRWQDACGAQYFRKVIYVLNRGGRFQDYEKAYDNEQLKNKYGRLINLYCEKVAKSKNAMNGKHFLGLASYFPITDVMGKLIEDEKSGFDMHLITYREISQCKTRTVTNYWLLGLLPENHILVNAKDALRLNLKDGRRVKVVSISNPKGIWDLKNGRRIPMVGKVKVTQGIRPGIVAFSLGHGNWANGSTDIVMDRRVIKGDGRRSKGINCNAAMRIDPYLKNTCLLDLVGGSVSFYDSKVRLVKV
ncbi:MAG: molybdopterin-dependent oxidoreductase [Candidatus Omnitrophota bacterium]|nr:molybdopterin-dependent oxidoreductase [Candidatus Omnitrophota bacterium]